jgi:hypothetical protein
MSAMITPPVSSPVRVAFVALDGLPPIRPALAVGAEQLYKRAERSGVPRSRQFRHDAKRFEFRSRDFVGAREQQPSRFLGRMKNSNYGRKLSALGIGEFVNKKLIRVA